MSEFNIIVDGGSSVRLQTAGKYCDRDIVVTATGGGGNSDLPTGYKRVDYINFTGEQIVDTGVICNRNTKLCVLFTREKSTQHYLYGVASSDNTASVTAYLGGSWRFGNKASTKNDTFRNTTIHRLPENARKGRAGNIRPFSCIFMDLWYDIK